MPLFNQNMSLRHRLIIFGVPTAIFVALSGSCSVPAHAGTGSTMWVKLKTYTVDAVLYNAGTAANPDYVVAEVDGPYAAHVQAVPGTKGRTATVRLINRRLSPSYKLTLGSATLIGCNVKVPDCSGADDSVKQRVTMHWWSGHPGWKIGTVDRYHRIRDIHLHIVKWFLETCGTNC